MRDQAVIASENAVVRNYALRDSLLDEVDFHDACLIFPDTYCGTVQAKSCVVALLIQSLVIEASRDYVGGACDIRSYVRYQLLNQQTGN